MAKDSDAISKFTGLIIRNEQDNSHIGSLFTSVEDYNLSIECEAVITAEGHSCTLKTPFNTTHIASQITFPSYTSDCGKRGKHAHPDLLN